MTTPSAPKVTRCPQCATAFRITNAQLQSAQGAVRCGSCLHVFKAQDHIVGELHSPKVDQTTGLEPQTLSSPSAANQPSSDAPEQLNSLREAGKPSIDAEVASDLDDLLISDDMDGDTSYQFDAPELDLSAHTNRSLFDRNLSYKKELEDSDTADESWAESLILDNEALPTFTANQVKSEDDLAAADDEAAAEAFYRREHSADNNQLYQEAPTATNPNLVFSLLDERALTPENSQHKNRAANTINQAEPVDPDLLGAAEIHAVVEAPEGDSAGRTKRFKTEPKIRPYDNSRAALLTHIIPAPLEFTAKRMRRWYQQKLWPALSLITFCLLIIQIAWFKFDYFSRVEPYRGAYILLCPLVDCQVPPLIDTRKISAYNLVVRAHPEIEGTLLIDAIILNKAPFDQPFPDVVLAFTDLNDQPVASRRFTPKEYLGGELAGKEIMPRNQPIHFALDVIDPGAEAVNYSIHIPQ